MSRVLPHLLSALAGTLSHIFYFKKGEHHANGSQYAKVFTGVFAAATALLHFTQSIAWDQASLTVCKFFLSYAIGLYSSLIIYRIFFHPLRKFPGPFFAGISSAWQPLAVNDQNNFRLLHRLHQKYGPFVRYGSSDLSITNPEAVPAIYGTGSPCIKGDWYDLSAPATSLQTFRDTKLHSQRRRVWSNAFSEKMVRGYEQRIKSYRQKLVDQLTIMDGQAVNIRKWLFLYGYDVMGDLAFGKGFDMLETGDQPWAVKLTNDAMDTIGLFLPTWLFMLMAAIPGLARGFWRYLDYCAKRLDRRMQVNRNLSTRAS